MKIQELEGLALDDPTTTALRKDIVRRKSFLYRLYMGFYKQIKDSLGDCPPGPIIELGSGPGFMKEVIPSVVTSDVFQVPGLDAVFSGHDLPFKNESISCFVMLDVFHHLPRPLEFLKEAERCLLQRGKVVMIEPYNSWFGRFFYQNFHHEPFDPEAGWELTEGGPLSGANGALPWIFFKRDNERFQKEVPRLRLGDVMPHTPFSYLLSGGVSYRSFLPGGAFGLIRFLESLLTPLNGTIGMFATIHLEKI